MERKSEAAKSSTCWKTLSGLSKNEVVPTRYSRKIQKIKTGKSANFDDDSESLSDIGDAEVFQHLNNKKEAHYKRMIWEAMNRDHEKGRNQKRARKVTKDDPTKQVIKPSRKMDNKKGLSSKINYDMLKKLMHHRVDKEDNGEDMDSHRGHHVEIQLPNDKSNPKTYSSEEDNDNEIEHGNDGCEDTYSIKDYGTNFGNDETIASINVSPWKKCEKVP